MATDSESDMLQQQHSSDNMSSSSVDDDEQVRALAQSLAPQMEELESLLATPVAAKTSSSSLLKDDDDNMDTEWSQLKDSELLLRQELEFAHDFSHLFDRPDAHDEEEVVPEPIHTQPIPQSPPPATVEQPLIQVSTPRNAYTLAHHARHLGFQMEPRGGWYSYPLAFSEETKCFAKEYILPIPLADLKNLFVGLVDPVPVILEETVDFSKQQHHQQPSLLDEDTASLNSTTAASVFAREEHVLPVRTVTIQIRPDVLCGAVMDAAHHALTNLQGEVTKRQGGHLRGVVGPTRMVTHHEVKYDDLPSRWTSPSDDATKQEQEDGALQLPSFMVDVQLCTYKGSSDHNCERTLLIRTFPMTEQDDDVIVPPMTESDPMDLDTPNLLLKEASALVQRIELEGSATLMDPKSSAGYFSPLKLFSSSPSSSSGNMPQPSQDKSFSSVLIQHARPCPSVLFGGLTLPALSKQDWPVAQSSWRFVAEIWNELSTRDLAHATLGENQFGAFPALPTLDVQYCSQMRRVCRESMVVSLLKSASELEQFARESEYSCASLIQMLKPTFAQYNLEPPALPQPVPLTAYPLDYTPPQVSCPPWGLKVMEALNQVAAQTSEANKLPLNVSVASIDMDSSFHAAEKAVALVMAAFQKQDDEEQGARLGRKNVQVMDRLAKMQAHKRASIQAISESYGRTPQSTKAADDFRSKALQVATHSDIHDYYEVPLFGCSILVGGTTTGTCYVTARHLLLVTQAIPLVGGNKCTLFDLPKVEFSLFQPSRLMNPIVAAGISLVVSNKVVYNFRPSVGAQRFKEFVEIIKEAAMENPDKLKFSDRGGLLYLYGDESNTPTKTNATTATTPTAAAATHQLTMPTLEQDGHDVVNETESAVITPQPTVMDKEADSVPEPQQSTETTTAMAQLKHDGEQQDAEVFNDAELTAPQQPTAPTAAVSPLEQDSIEQDDAEKEAAEEQG